MNPFFQFLIFGLGLVAVAVLLVGAVVHAHFRDDAADQESSAPGKESP